MTQSVGNAPEYSPSTSRPTDKKELNKLVESARETEKPLTLGDVLREEYAAIAGENPPASDDLGNIIEQIHGRRHAAVCLSGGGIRSATFNLGMLQALAKRRFLQRFHYLSTVSGGGYIGSWLSSWIARGGFKEACECLAFGRDTGAKGPLHPIDNEPEPIHHLRSFSRYLSPRVGLFSADTWTLAAAYIRNLLLTWLVLLPALAAMATIPLIAVSTTLWIERNASSAPHWGLMTIVLVGVALAVQAVRYVHGHRPRNPEGDDAAKATSSTKSNQRNFLLLGLAPFVCAGICLTTSWLWIAHLDAASLLQSFAAIPRWIPLPRFSAQPSDPSMHWSFELPMMYLGMFVHVAGWASSGRVFRRSARIAAILEFFVVLLTGAACGFALGWAAWTSDPWSSTSENIEPYTVFALPAFAAMLLFFGDLHLGAVSILPRRSADAEREWGARFNAWVLIVSSAWIVASTLTVLVPSYIDGVTGTWLRWSSLGTYALGAVASWLGFASKTGSTSGSAGAGVAKTLKSLSPSLALALATTGFCLLLPIVLAEAGLWLIRAVGCAASSCSFRETLAVSPLLIVELAVKLLFVSLIAGFFIDMNKFSLHGLYRIRLIRAYLGASRKESERDVNPFTGFDMRDNMLMRDLRPKRDEDTSGRADCDDSALARSSEHRPLHIVNVALNLVHGAELAWQDRKAESFTISPLHAGNCRLGYRRTSPSKEQRELEVALAGPAGAGLWQWRKRRYSPRYYGGECGVSLGTAMAISGAAASPNMGYHSSATVTFLMTLFNARLGWWLGNPRAAGNGVYYRHAPRVSLLTLWSELFGLTDANHKYVYLSDGGHFDNLGLYEMVLRRCRFIIVSDASADKECNLADLGHAIRAIRADMQIPIEFDYNDFKIQKRSIDGKVVADGAYWATARIRYSAVDRRAGLSDDEAKREYDGVLLYVKPSFYGKEPRDVYNYAIESPSFPHESTADQFFGESQFESYRALGEYIGDIICQDPKLDVEALFKPRAPVRTDAIPAGGRPA